MNLLFTIDKNYIPVFAVCLKSILQNGGDDHYEVYILHSDLEEEHKEEIKLLSSRVNFRFIEVDPALFAGFPVSARYPVQIYYRLAAPLLLPEDIERILYLDGDTITINSLKELYNMDFEGNLLIGCSHTGAILNTVNQVRLGMEKSVPYINSGVMLFNLPALREELSIQDIQQYASGRDLILFLPDQDMLTALYGQKVKLADWRKYNLGEKAWIQNNLDPAKETIDLDWIRENTCIIHYYGKNKPWKENLHGSLGEFYDKVVRKKEMHILLSDDKYYSQAVKAARNIQSSVEHCLYFDGQWAWDSKPYIDNRATRKVARENIQAVLKNFLASPCYDAVVFVWKEKCQPLVREILSSLDLEYVQLSEYSLDEDGRVVLQEDKTSIQPESSETIQRKLLELQPSLFHKEEF